MSVQKDAYGKQFSQFTVRTPDLGFETIVADGMADKGYSKTTEFFIDAVLEFVSPKRTPDIAEEQMVATGFVGVLPDPWSEAFVSEFMRSTPIHLHIAGDFRTWLGMKTHRLLLFRRFVQNMPTTISIEDAGFLRARHKKEKYVPSTNIVSSLDYLFEMHSKIPETASQQQFRIYPSEPSSISFCLLTQDKTWYVPKFGRMTFPLAFLFRDVTSTNRNTVYKQLQRQLDDFASRVSTFEAPELTDWWFSQLSRVRDPNHPNL